MVRTAGYGATFVSALSCSTISFVCYAFVDDMDLVHTRPGDDHTGSDLIPEMQEALDHWEGGLRTSYGALIPSKSHWYLVGFKRKNGFWNKYSSNADRPGDITLRDHLGDHVPLERVEVTEARKSLGVMISGDCSWTAEAASLLQASVLW